MSSTDFSTGREPPPPKYRQLWDKLQRLLSRPATVKQFLESVKVGDTVSALECLAQNPKLLAYHTFASDGNTVWHLLAEFGDASQMQALINFCKIHGGHQTLTATPQPRVQSNPASRGDDDPVGSALRSLVNRGNKLKQRPLMFAAYHGREDVVKLLLQQGADPWLQDRCGQRTALHYAALKGHAACVRALLDTLPPEHMERNGTRYVDAPTASGFTPLHLAVASGSLPTLRALLAWHPCLHAANRFDAGEFWLNCDTLSTPLHVAAFMGSHHAAMAILCYYVEHKSEQELEDPRSWCDIAGHTPYWVARYRGHAELAAKLSQSASIMALWSPAELAELAGHGAVEPLKNIAAREVMKQLLASVQEAEEGMRLLGTYQQHGRVFGRVAMGGQSSSLVTSSGLPDIPPPEPQPSGFDLPDIQIGRYSSLRPPRFSMYGALESRGSAHPPSPSQRYIMRTPTGVALTSTPTAPVPLGTNTSLSVTSASTAQAQGPSPSNTEAFARSSGRPPSGTGAGASSSGVPGGSGGINPIGPSRSLGTERAGGSSSGGARSSTGTGSELAPLPPLPPSSPRPPASVYAAHAAPGNPFPVAVPLEREVLPQSGSSTGTSGGLPRRGGSLKRQQQQQQQQQPQSRNNLRPPAQSVLQAWFSYNNERGVFVAKPGAPVPALVQKGNAGLLHERSMLSRAPTMITPVSGCAAWLPSCLGGGDGSVYLPPQPGEDVCGLCRDNKPLLRVVLCQHRTCLLCAKRLCGSLEVQQIPTCPFCGVFITGFELA